VEVRVPIAALRHRAGGSWVDAAGSAVVAIARFAGDPAATEIELDLVP
jgi:hypothetical protein